jgi:DNA primase
MGRIPQNFIDDLVARADIVEVINARVPLKKKGREYSACCPFHNEKTPSFTVSETKQFYHCFGCGAHGTAIGFLMEYEHLDFVDAVEALAAEYHIEVPREESPHASGKPDIDKQPLYDVLEQAAVLYQQQLRTSDRAIGYLKQRGLSGEIAQRYRMGYAPDSWSFLADSLGKTKTGIKHLLAAGLLIEKAPDRYYDRFRDRIMFPILDQRGRVIGFGGRILDQGEPKYLNSPETAVFHKGLELYGMYEARLAVRQLERICIVEGYMDVVALAQNGIEYAVASLGTATTGEQIQKTFRSVREIIFCYDGDNAGRKAAWRALENTLPILRDGMIARFLLMPEGEDPDTLVRKEGNDRFEQRLENATPLSDFLFEHLQQEHDITSSEGKASLAERARPLFAKMPNSILRELLLNKLARLIDIDVQRLDTPTSRISHTSRSAASPQPDTTQKGPGELRVCIALLLQHPPLATLLELPAEFRESEINGVPLLFDIYRTIIDKPTISGQAILERWRDKKELPILEKLSFLDIPGTGKSDIREQLYFETTSRLISRLRYETRYEILQAKVEAGGMNVLSKEELEEYRELVSGNRRTTHVDSEQG